MNRQARRRAEREGKKGPKWDIIIPSILVVLVLAVFIGNYLFPSLDLPSYAGAPARVLKKITTRGLSRLEADWPDIDLFSYGYFLPAAEEEEESTWPTYLIEKKEDVWSFVELESEEATEYTANELPDFYEDVPKVVETMKSVLTDKNFIISYQQTVDKMNMISFTRVVDQSEGKQEQYVLGFDADHNIDRIIYLNTLAEDVVGRAYADLYSSPYEMEIITP